jgi:hypothetical protein
LRSYDHAQLSQKKVQIQFCYKNFSSMSDVATTKIRVHAGYVIKTPWRNKNCYVATCCILPPDRHWR